MEKLDVARDACVLLGRSWSIHHSSSSPSTCAAPSSQLVSNPDLSSTLRPANRIFKPPWTTALLLRLKKTQLCFYV